jgi:hypothetical protein
MLHQKQMTGGRNRDEFGQALQHTEQAGLENIKDHTLARGRPPERRIIAFIVG